MLLNAGAPVPERDYGQFDVASDGRIRRRQFGPGERRSYAQMVGCAVSWTERSPRAILLYN